MCRAAAAVLAVLLALACAPAHAAAGPLLPAPAIPPELQTLETKADALQITSERLTLTSSLRLGHVPKPAREFARLLDFKIEGVETSSPAATALTATLFGSRARLRYVEGHEYLFSWDLGRRDGGRPWVELGHDTLGALFGGVGTKPAETGTSGAERYRKLFTLLNDGTGIHELAPVTLYGQAVTGFEAEVEPQQAAGSTGSGGPQGAFDTATHPVQAPTDRLSVYFAASGAIVRAQVESGGASAGATVTSDVPAIDFPYTIPAPPVAHVISERLALERFSRHISSQVRGPTRSSSSSGTSRGTRK